MAKIGRNQSTGRFKLERNGEGGCATVTDKVTGRVLPLEGYGALKGQFHVRKGIDLTEPIAAQVLKRKPGKASRAKSV